MTKTKLPPKKINMLAVKTPEEYNIINIIHVLQQRKQAAALISFNTLDQENKKKALLTIDGCNNQLKKHFLIT